MLLPNPLLERTNHLKREVDNYCVVQFAFCRLEAIFQSFAYGVLHHEVMPVLFAEAVIDAHDVMMREAGKNICLAIEGRYRLLLCSRV